MPPIPFRADGTIDWDRESIAIAPGRFMEPIWNVETIEDPASHPFIEVTGARGKTAIIGKEGGLYHLIVGAGMREVGGFRSARAAAKHLVANEGFCD